MVEQNRDAVERLQRGLIIALIAIVGVLVVVLAVRMLRGGTELLHPVTTPSEVTSSDTADSVDTLLAQARGAMADSRMVSPTGDNAYEHYLAVLEQQPGNVSAREALNDLYGIAVSSAEQAIGAGNFQEAERLASMLARSNPNSYTVINLRQRIERAVAAMAAADQAPQQAPLRDAQLGDATAAPSPTPPLPQPVPEPASDLASATSPTSSPAASPPVSSSSVAATSPATTRSTAATTTPSPAASSPAVPAIREARLLSRMNPEYPREAVRNRQQGWVEVEFTIGRDGAVSDVRVVASRPSRIFDRAAMRAIQEWRFEPRMENGQVVTSRLRQRFDFTLD